MKTVISMLTTRGFCLALCLCALANARAQKLLLDFGPTAVAPAEAVLSMGHFAGAVPGTEISWNQILNADNSSLVYSDGSAATGVSIVVGRSPAGVSNSVDYANKLISSSALGGSATWGIYTNTSPVKDGIFATGNSSVPTNILGIRVDGLASGTYTLYISGRNTSTGFTSPMRFFATNGASAGTFTFDTNTTPSVVEVNSGTAIGSLPTQADATTSTFAYGDNCVHLVVTLNSGESIFLAITGVDSSAGFRGFLNAVEIVPGAPVLTNFPATVGRQPSNVSVYEGATVSINNVKYGGVPPLTYQWYHNAAPIDGATNSTLTLTGVTTNDGGNYSVTVANIIATDSSSNAVITVVPFYDTAQMTNLWNLLPGSRFYITSTDGGERGLAYNPTTTNLLVVTHVPTNNIVVLDPATGAEKYFMNIENVPPTAAGINMIGVGTDGMVYTCGATANAGSPSTPFNLIWWANDDANTPPGNFAFSGDPGQPDTGVGAVGLRWGDSFAVRGGGATAEFLCGPGSGTNVCLFTTADGMNFTPNIITITNEVPSGFAQLGIAFGPGTNTFWAKTLNQALYLVEFDLSTKLGAVIFSSTNVPPSTLRFIATDPENKWLAGIMRVASGLPQNVRLYDMADFTNAFVLVDQELYSTNVNSGFLNGAGSGSTAFGGDYLFALNSNNGLKAFLINTNTTSVLAPFSITSLVPSAGPAVILTWPSVSGHTYQVQAKSALTNSAWSDLGPVIPGTGSPLSFTNSSGGGANFYRIKGQ
jgi:hypothetical protein